MDLTIAYCSAFAPDPEFAPDPALYPILYPGSDAAPDPVLAPVQPPLTETEDRQDAPEHWMEQAFSCPTARNGGVIKRRVSDVERIVGRDLFLTEVRRRGFQAIENGDALVIFCNDAPVRLAAARGPLILR